MFMKNRLDWSYHIDITKRFDVCEDEGVERSAEKPHAAKKKFAGSRILRLSRTEADGNAVDQMVPRGCVPDLQYGCVNTRGQSAG